MPLLQEIEGKEGLPKAACAFLGHIQEHERRYCQGTRLALGGVSEECEREVEAEQEVVCESESFQVQLFLASGNISSPGLVAAFPRVRTHLDTVGPVHIQASASFFWGKQISKHRLADPTNISSTRILSGPRVLHNVLFVVCVKECFVADQVQQDCRWHEMSCRVRHPSKCM